MNTVTTAIESAGFRKPTLMCRVWTWLRDNGPHTARDVAAALDEPNASTMCSQMARRSMVSYIREDRKGAGRPLVTVYSAIGKTYELLPLPKNGKKTPKAPAVTAPIVIVNTPVPTPKPKHGVDIEQLSLSAARQLYYELHAIFGGAL